MGLKRFFESRLPGLDNAGLKDEDTGEVILKADTFTYFWPIAGDFYLTQKFCFYGVGKIIGEGKDKKFIEVIPAKSDWIRQVNVSVLKECPSYAFEARKENKLITYNEKGEVLLAA